MLYINYPAWLKPEIVPFLPIRWYGLMYIVAFGIAYALFKKQLNESPKPALTEKQTDDLFFTAIVLLLLGARLFYVLFYNPAAYLADPLSIIWPFDGKQFVGIQGLSYHGGLAGGIAGIILYCKRQKISLAKTFDLVGASIPFGYTFGRLGNFINAELYGKVTANPLGVLFPQAEPVFASLPWAQKIAEAAGIAASGAFVNLPRHPSQLYEALFEGIVLGLFLWFFVRKRVKTPGMTGAFYIMGYGFMRFFIEYLREPDEQLGYILAFGHGKETPQIFASLLNFSMGQLWCLLMMAGAALWMVLLKRNAARQPKARQ